MLSGRYPSDEFAELRPRIVWDRVDRHAAPAGPARSGSRSPAAARSPTAACSASSWSARSGSPGRRARRGDGLRVAGRRRVRARLDVLADRGHHPRPGAGLPRARAAGQAAVLERRRARPAGRAGPGARRVPARAVGARRRRGARARLRGGRARRAGPPTTCWPTSPSSARPPGMLPDDRTIVVERFRDELGDWRRRRPLAVRRAGQRAVGAGDRPRGCASATASTCRRCTPTTASCCGCPRPTRPPPAELAVVRRPTRSRQLVTDEVGGSALFAVAVPRVRRPGAAAAPPRPGPAHAAVAAAAAGGAAARGRPRVRLASRSCWRRCASACRTSSTCPGWSS